MKHHMTTLKAEILLIRLRQAIDDWHKGSKEEEREVIKRWKMLV